MKNQILSHPRARKSTTLRPTMLCILAVIFLVHALGSSAAAQRDVRFLATADPQFENDPHATTARWGKRVITVSTMFQLNKLLISKEYRGLLVAGDLTQLTRKEEWDDYVTMRGSLASLYYDGLGNHDMTTGNCCIGLGHSGYCTCPDSILEDMGRVRESWTEVDGVTRRLQTKYKVRLTPHYSWDWDDVHFVQLNLYPGTEVVDERDLGTENPAILDPRFGLNFLQYDLLFHGNKGRPIVLIHHYCLNPASNLCTDDRWWNDEKKEAYWKVIAGYNVVAIITGHWHTPPPDQWAYSWPKPDPSLPGPAAIPTFIVGAALAGTYVDFHITKSSLKAVRHHVTDWDRGNVVSSDRSCMEVPIQGNGQAGPMTKVTCAP